MAFIDWLMVLIVTVSAVLSYMRGFFKVGLSFATWLAAILVTSVFTSRVASMLPTDIFETTDSRYVASAALLFLGSLFVGGVISWLFRLAVGPTTRSPTDRVLGVLFGTARGMLMIAVVVFLSNLMPALKQENWWQESRLIPRFQVAARVIHAQLPEELAVYFDLYSPSQPEFQLTTQ